MRHGDSAAAARPAATSATPSPHTTAPRRPPPARCPPGAARAAATRHVASTPTGETSRNRGRSSASSSTSLACTSPPGPKVTTGADVRPAMASHPLVAGEEHGRAVGRQRGDQLALGLGHRRRSCRTASVWAAATVVTTPTVGRRDRAEGGDVADAARAHLHDDRLGAVRRAEQRQRHAQLVVERPLAGRRCAAAGPATAASRSFTDVLPTDPVMPMTGAVEAPARRPPGGLERPTVSSTTIAEPPTGSRSVR